MNRAALRQPDLVRKTTYSTRIEWEKNPIACIISAVVPVCAPAAFTANHAEGLTLGIRRARLWATCFCALGAFVGTRAEAQWHYYYFDEAKPLTLDPTRVAVRMPAGTGNVAATPTAITSDRAMLADGWDLVHTPNGVASADMATHVAAMGAANSYASPVFLDASGSPILITPDILLGFKDGVDPARVTQILSSLPVARVAQRRFGGMAGAYRLASGRQSGFDVLTVANALAELPEISFAEPNMVFCGHSSGVPTDPFFSDAWALDNTGQFGGTPGIDLSALSAWQQTTGDPSVIVAILDSGVEIGHPDLHQFFPGTDTTSDASTDGGPVNTFDDHGTTVAGCISGILNNGLGAAGIAPDCLTASARTFIHINGAGNWISESSWTVDSLAWAESIGAQVTNNSNCYAVQSSAIAAKYASTRDNCIVHFASSCNDGAAMIAYPSSLPSVNSIGAIDENGALASFSNVGTGLAFVAPGVQIITTDRTGPEGFDPGDFAFVQGTSYASPYAAGVAALLISLNPSVPANLVEAAMRETAIDLGEPGYDIVTGYGLVSAANVLQWQLRCASLEPTLAEPVPIERNRYVAFTPPQDGQRRAIRFTLESLPPPHDSLNGTVLWVGAPLTLADSEKNGTQFFGATLQCTPLFRDWSDVDLLQVFGPEIMPEASYRTETVLESCFAQTTQFPSYYSASSFTTTAQIWGDIAPPFTGDPLNPQPDFRDITAIIATFLGNDEALPKTQADLVPETPDAVANFLDITAVVKAFLNGGYPFPGPTASCP